MSMIEIPDPLGYRVVRFGTPLKGHSYLSSDGTVCVASRDYAIGYYPILETVEVWRDATIDDLKRLCRARFRPRNDSSWTDSQLIGGKWSRIASSYFWLSSDEIWYSQCQVLEQPK